MEITFTKEQYEALVKLVYLGNWMVNAIRPDEGQIQAYNDLEQYVYSFARAAGLEQYIQFDSGIKKFITNWEKDEHPEVDHYIDDYSEENFWHELVHRLAERDMLFAFGQEAVHKMPLQERMEKQDSFLEKYSKEFEQNGIARLDIVPR